MKVVRSKEFTGPRPWAAIVIANMGGTTTRLHWTDQPYKWHVNDGEEVFAVLDGIVDMHYRERGSEIVVTLHAGDVFYADAGCEHVAPPSWRGTHFGRRKTGQCLNAMPKPRLR